MAAIVEGHGEVQAVPVLIRRIAAEVVPHQDIIIKPILRVPANRLVKQGELERTVDLAARKLEGSGGIFILLDCDWENCCPKDDGPKLLQRAKNARLDFPVSLVLAYQEYEAWFIAAADSLKGLRGLPETLETIPDPESIRGAKEWLSTRMPRYRPYTETLDQPGLTQCFDIQAARRSRSFDKCYREIRDQLLLLQSKAASLELGKPH